MPSCGLQRLTGPGVLLIAITAAAGCWTQNPALPAVTFIPKSTDGLLWEMERSGATAAAEGLNWQISWKAPTSESDFTGQVSLIDQARQSGGRGLVLAPNHQLAPLGPLRRVLEEGIPVVVISTPLGLPAGGKLGYIVNDDAKMGELAAAEAARLIDGIGSVALVGLSRSVPGVMDRVRGAEKLLADQFPGIQVVSRRGGAFSASSAQQEAAQILSEYADLGAILTFTVNSTRGVHAALTNRKAEREVHLVGCDQDTDLLGYVASGDVAAIVAADVYRMAYEGVEAVSASSEGRPMPALSVVPPILITKQNLYSAEVRSYTEPIR